MIEENQEQTELDSAEASEEYSEEALECSEASAEEENSEGSISELDSEGDSESSSDEITEEQEEQEMDASTDSGELEEISESEELVQSVESEESENQPVIDEHQKKLLQSMRLEARLEAVIFAAQKPIKVPEILEILGDDDLSAEDIQATLDQLTEHYEDRVGGFRLRYISRLGYQFQTAAEAGPIMGRMFASRPRPISRAALETLSIIAYRQPVTRAQVEFIRGVDAGSIFKTLMERDLVKCVGRKEVVGRPMIFGTTDDFLKVFNLSSLKDLPSLESFQPAPDAMQGAREKLDSDGESDLVDIEQYISDNTEEVPFSPSEESSQEASDYTDTIEGEPEIEAGDDAEGESESLQLEGGESSSDEASELKADIVVEGASAAQLDEDDFEEIANVMADDEVDADEALMGATSDGHQGTEDAAEEEVLIAGGDSDNSDENLEF